MARIRRAKLAAWLQQPLESHHAPIPYNGHHDSSIYYDTAEEQRLCQDASRLRHAVDVLFRQLIDYCVDRDLRDPVYGHHMFSASMREAFYALCMQASL